jgi:class 3 adenylate cyclase
MGLVEDLGSEVKNVLKSSWQMRQGSAVPSDSDIALANQGVELDGAVLYADLVDSTGLVLHHELTFAAEVYKSYLIAACRVIKTNGGSITAFDGDRVMAVFVGPSKCDNAARTALQIAWAVQQIVNPSIAVAYPAKQYRVRQAVGVDSGKLLVAKTGVRGSNDLVWTGLAANRAAKLCALRFGGFTSWITDSVFRGLHRNTQLDSNGQRMWNVHPWVDQGIQVHGSQVLWPI